MILLDFKDGSYVFVKDISEIELKEINDDKKSKRERIVSKNGINIEVYNFYNGKIISKYNDAFTVFNDSIDFRKAINDGYFDDYRSQSIMLKKNFYGERFPEHTEEMIQNLLKKLNLSTTVLDNNLLINIETAINSMQNPFVFYRENFTAIIALLGEMLIRNKNRLKWKITLASDNETWEPGIEGSDSRVHYIFPDLYEYIFFDNNIDSVLSEEYGTLRIIVR